MSGQAGARGYLVQALISVLDAVNDSAWEAITLEPNTDADKVDIAWLFAGRKRVVQVKSSQNAIGVADVRRWARELTDSTQADEYELRLIGPVSAGVTDLRKCGAVQIPTPQPLNADALLEQAAHKLDHYLQNAGYVPIRPGTRELMVGGLVTKLATFSTRGQRLSRRDFDRLLATWVIEVRRHSGVEMSDPTPPGSQIPHELPNPPPNFTGRTKELVALKDQIRQTTALVGGIRGMAGIGKSALASKLARDLLDDYPDGQLHLDLRGLTERPAAPVEVMGRIVRSFQLEAVLPDDAAECAAQYRTALHGRRILILAENALSAEQIESIVPGAGSFLLYTSRQQLVIPGAIAVDLPLLSKEDAIQMTLSIAPGVGGSAAFLVERCGFLPLAIRVSSSTLAARPDISPADYVRNLDDATKRLSLVESSIELSVLVLSADSKRFFLQLAPFATDFDLAALTAGWETDEDVASHHIGELLSHSLVEWDETTGRYRMHDLIRLYARKHVSDQDASMACTRLSTYYLQVARQIESLYQQGGEHVYGALAWFDEERENITAGFAMAASNSHRSDEAATVCSDYVNSTLFLRDLRQSPVERLFWLEAATAAQARLGDMNAIVSHMGNLGRVLRELGFLDRSRECHENVLQLAEAHKCLPDQARAHLQIGLVLVDSKDYPKALEHMQTALRIANEIPDVSLRVHILNNLGVTYMRLDQSSVALDYLRRALDLVQEANDPPTLAMLLNNLGQLGIHSSDPLAAVDMLENAVNLARDLGDTRIELSSLWSLGLAYTAVTRNEDARKTLNQALGMARRVGDATAESEILGDIGDIDLAERNLEAAEETFNCSLSVAKKSRNPRIEGYALRNLAELAKMRGDKGRVVQLLRESLAKATESGDRRSIAMAAGRLGTILQEETASRECIDLMQMYVDYLRETGHEGTAKAQERVDRLRESVKTEEC